MHGPLRLAGSVRERKTLQVPALQSFCLKDGSVFCVKVPLWSSQGLPPDHACAAVEHMPAQQPACALPCAASSLHTELLHHFCCSKVVRNCAIDQTNYVPYPALRKCPTQATSNPLRMAPFDVAVPVNQLSTGLRMRPHSGTQAPHRRRYPVHRSPQHPKELRLM
jgi:hypothetical protein